MNITYHEATMLIHLPSSTGGAATLGDIHKYAWAVFTRDGTYQASPRRPFVFRFEPTVAGHTLLTLRADRPFHGATPQTLSVTTGQFLTLDLAMIPTRRRQNREYTPKSQDWPGLWANKLERAGFRAATDNITIDLLERRHWNSGQRTLAVVNGCAHGEITDTSAFARAWLQGVGRRKAYGFGLLRQSPNQKQRH